MKYVIELFYRLMLLIVIVSFFGSTSYSIVVTPGVDPQKHNHRLWQPGRSTTTRSIIAATTTVVVDNLVPGSGVLGIIQVRREQ
jgi:hypothetical protein